LTSPYSGKVVKLYHKVQDTVKVGSALVDIADGSAAPAAAPSAPAAAPASSTPAPAAVATGGAGVQAFKLADIGEGIAEVQLTEWFVKEGDMVKEMDNICSVESDKASVELSSPYTGKVVKVHHKVQDTVKVGSILVEIETGSGGAAAAAPTPPTPVAAAESAPVAVPVPTPAAAPATPAPGAGIKAPGVLATPKVRHLAKQKGVNLNNVTGSGTMGRVLESDVLAAVEGAPAASPQAAAAPAEAASAAPVRPPIRPGEDTVVEITDNVGKGMVKSMNEALKMPVMALGEEIDITTMIKLQKQLKGSSEKKYGTKVTLTSFMVKALSMALSDHPKINSKFGPSDANPPNFTVLGSHNVSIAIDTPHGLVVPNIKDCANLSLVEIQQEIKRLAADAMANKLKISDIQGGTITLSNIGVIGTKDPRPIPFGGQAVIGASGRTMTLPRYNDKMEIEPRQIMNIRWVADHRHLDGATLARFSNSYKQYMEEPGEWMLKLR